MRYFEIYVAGSHGFSAYVKTNTPLPEDFEELILNMAVEANVIDGGDAKEIFHGAGYVEERTEKELHKDTKITEIGLASQWFSSLRIEEQTVVLAAARIALQDELNVDSLRITDREAFNLVKLMDKRNLGNRG